MNEPLNKKYVDEKYFYKSIIYIEELIIEFGVLHPLVDKTMEGLFRRITDEGSNFSEDLSVELTRYLERWLARIDKAIEEQRHLAIERSKTSWFNVFALGSIFLGIAAVLYHCFKKDEPVQALHHHFGSVTENIKINHSGHITKNINLKLNKF